jgi:hypothetical protein
MKFSHSRKPSNAIGDHIELVTYLVRKPGMSRKEFNDHWQNTYSKVIASWAEKHGVVSYKQVCILRRPVAYDGIILE